MSRRLAPSIGGHRHQLRRGLEARFFSKSYLRDSYNLCIRHTNPIKGKGFGLVEILADKHDW